MLYFIDIEGSRFDFNIYLLNIPAQDRNTMKKFAGSVGVGGGEKKNRKLFFL
jgi:hypothetical protein